MAKTHTYEETTCEDCATQGEHEERERQMLARCLESIGDLLDEEARGCGTRLSIQQQQEMDNIIKDARVQGLLT